MPSLRIFIKMAGLFGLGVLRSDCFHIAREVSYVSSLEGWGEPSNVRGRSFVPSAPFQPITWSHFAAVFDDDLECLF